MIMEKKVVSVLAILGFVVLFFSLLSSVFAADYTVSGNDFDDIQNTIDGSNSGDRILLGNKNYIGSGSRIEVNNNKDIVIQGQSNTNRANLNANNLHGILYIESGSVATIKYVNFVNGGSTTHALGAYGTLNIEDCTFTHSRGDSGSAIYINSSNSIVKNCKFVDSYSNNHNANDYTAGGAICVNGANNVKIMDCSFDNSRALNYGGAIMVRTQSTGTQITNCNFTNNNAPTGGAVTIGTGSSATIDNCIFKNNKATDNGGAIYTAGTTTIRGSKFNNNYANNGSGIYNNGILNLASNTIMDNIAKIYKINIEALNKVGYTDTIIIKSYLTGGDNIANGIFNNGKITGISNQLYKIPNKNLSLNFNGRTYTNSTGANGIALFHIPTKNKLKLGTYNYQITHTQNTGNLISKSSVKITKKTVTTTKTKKIKQIYKTYKNKKKNGWEKTNKNHDNYKFPDKKFRWYLTIVTTTITYEPVTKWAKTTSKYNSKTKTKTKTTISPKKGTIKTKTVKIVKTSNKQTNIANPYLSSSVGCEINDKQIKNLAKKFNKYSNQKEKANALYKYVRKNIKYSEFLPKSAVEAWKSKKTNCVGFSHLIVAIARASGIPAQYESKGKATGPTIENHAGHVWALLYINGKWVSADGTIKFVDQNGKYLKTENLNLNIGYKSNWNSYKAVSGGHMKNSNFICDEIYFYCTNKILNGIHVDNKIEFCKINHHGWK